MLQFDLWGMNEHSGRWDWDAQIGYCNTWHGEIHFFLLQCQRFTSQILGNNECFEAFTSNLYSRRTLSGEFVLLNKHLVQDLIEEGIWGPHMKGEIIRNKGSIQPIEGIPDHIKALYKTTWEISQKQVLNMAADRGAYIDQSQSLNIHMFEPNAGKSHSVCISMAGN